MQVKKELAARIVADFHSAADAKQAGEDFAREVQQGAEPSDMDEVILSGPNRLAQVLVSVKLASSRSEAERLIKAGAVEINGERSTNPVSPLPAGNNTARVGQEMAAHHRKVKITSMGASTSTGWPLRTVGR